MKVAGIVAEYNPFHLGHQYHIERTRGLLGEDCAVVCVMSGDFVQRGEAAVYSKFARGEAACRCGADLVVELPLPWSLSSAEGFARGAVSLLDRIGCDSLSFGSESGDIKALTELAKALLTDELNENVRSRLAETPNLSYAAARQQAINELFGDCAELLSSPNDILAVEYLKSIFVLHSCMQPLAVERSGSRHDGRGGIFPSAAELRGRLCEGTEIRSCLPPDAAEVFEREDAAGVGRPDPERMEAILLSRLRSLSEADYEALPDAADGLGQRLYRAASELPDLASIIEAVKTKRYAMSRIRRMICCAALGIRSGNADGVPPYARVLAANVRGCELLHGLRGSTLPVITKPASVRELDDNAVEIFELGSRAHDLFALCSSRKEMRRGGEDWRTSPLIL